MSGQLSKIRSLHTYIMYRMFYFEWYCMFRYLLYKKALNSSYRPDKTVLCSSDEYDDGFDWGFDNYEDDADDTECSTDNLVTISVSKL